MVADGGAFDYGNQVTPGYSGKSHDFFPTIIGCVVAAGKDHKFAIG
jgi:hypothetical protein